MKNIFACLRPSKSGVVAVSPVCPVTAPWPPVLRPAAGPAIRGARARARSVSPRTRRHEHAPRHPRPRRHRRRLPHVPAGGGRAAAVRDVPRGAAAARAAGGRPPLRRISCRRAAAGRGPGVRRGHSVRSRGECDNYIYHIYLLCIHKSFPTLCHAQP